MTTDKPGLPGGTNPSSGNSGTLHQPIQATSEKQVFSFHQLKTQLDSIFDNLPDSFTDRPSACFVDFIGQKHIQVRDPDYLIFPTSLCNSNENQNIKTNLKIWVISWSSFLKSAIISNKNFEINLDERMLIMGDYDRLTHKNVCDIFSKALENKSIPSEWIDGKIVGLSGELNLLNFSVDEQSKIIYPYFEDIEIGIISGLPNAENSYGIELWRIGSKKESLKGSPNKSGSKRTPRNRRKRKKR